MTTHPTGPSAPISQNPATVSRYAEIVAQETNLIPTLLWPHPRRRESSLRRTRYMPSCGSGELFPNWITAHVEERGFTEGQKRAE